jgi:acetone carboxylase, gamma subunit
LRPRITEYLEIDLDTEQWHCVNCGASLGSARDNYKHGCLVWERDPRDVHRPVVDGEYTCPGCATLIEVEYLPPGHPVTHDIELDIDALKQRYAAAEASEATE